MSGIMRKKNKGNDDDEEEEPSDNLIQNGNFEKNFAEDQQPGVFSADKTDQKWNFNYLDRWFFCLPDAPSCNMTIDKSEGANNSSRSLKYEATEIMDAEKVNLSYALQNVMEGRYTFSYYVKTNQDDTPFTLSIVVCETEDDIPLVLKRKSEEYHFQSGRFTVSFSRSHLGACGPVTIKSRKRLDQILRYSRYPRKCTYTIRIQALRLCRRHQHARNLGKRRLGVVLFYWFDEFSLIPVE